MNYNEYSQEFGKMNYLINKHICVIEDFNEDGIIKGQVIKTIADRKGKLYKGNCPVPLNPGKYYFYVSDEEVKDINKIKKYFCTDEIEITDEYEQLVELPIENIINEITINVYIIEGTYWDKKWGKKQVKEQFNGTKTILNNHFEKYNYNTRINFKITHHTIVNSDLKIIELLDNYTPILRKLIENGVDNNSSSLNIVFTNILRNPSSEEGRGTYGVYFSPTTVAIISMGAITIKTTTAHEICHFLGLDDLRFSEDVNNLMLDPTYLPRDFKLITLTSDQIENIERQLTDFKNQTGDI
jgi:hypothetical protein